MRNSCNSLALYSEPLREPTLVNHINCMRLQSNSTQFGNKKNQNSKNIFERIRDNASVRYPEKHLVRALIHFWDPDRVVFKLIDFGMTPTLEEINYFTNLIYQGRGHIIPHGQSGIKFLRYLGLKNTKELRCFENNWVSLDYVYERYGCRGGYKLFKNEFSCTPDHWQARCPIAFIIGLKGLQPYAPLRVLRQFGQEQIIPLRANMRVSEIQFGPNFIIPRARKILDEWNDIDKMDNGDSQA
ncbi:hypothetical protein RND71_019514 [Anisodus tanguticus]|uniref:Uncharacterized protein n=1 Tax=Anisodus tanguticus TaxID=243964 RepID=A0AAE1V9F7_9SOLA|nr:hypothetical protein RND71_019514 [Anisodus tanguticus]